MKTIFVKLPAIILAVLFFSSCSTKFTDDLNTFNEKFNVRSLSAEQMAKILSATDSNTFVIIDVRNPHEYKNGHLRGAVNIPSKKIFDDQYEDIWESKKIKIVYGKNSGDAIYSAYWALYNGYNDVYAALGGYDILQKNFAENFAPYSANYDDEKPLYDFAEKFKELKGSGAQNTQSQTAQQPQPQINVPQTNEEPSGGGCE